MPDGSFIVSDQLDISREGRPPYSPLIKIKDGLLAGSTPEKMSDYLYYIEFSDWNYDKALSYMIRRYTPVGACSAVRNGDFYGRHYDWFYDETASFVIRCKATLGRHASVGVAGSLDGLTMNIVDSGEFVDAYNILPFVTLDGVNDAGVVCNVNMLPSDDGTITTGSHIGGKDLPMTMVVRYILDYANSAEHALELLGEANVISPQSDKLHGQFHWMIADKNDTFVVEFDGNDMVVVDEFVGDKPIMTNFFLNGFDGNTSTAYHNPEGFDADETTLTPHAMGLERFDILSSGYAGASTKGGMLSLLKNVEYSNAYDLNKNPFWYSEFVANYGSYDLDYNSEPEDFAHVIEVAQEHYREHKRNSTIWQTVHCSVYDIRNKTLTIRAQEEDAIFEFALEELGALPVSPDNMILTAPNGTKYKLSVSNDGELLATAIV